MPAMPPKSVQKYSYAQLEALWIQAGGDRASAPIMAAIALAESSGNPAAINRNTNGSTDRGLWQINSVHGSLSTFDPLANAKAAVKIKSTQGLSAWVTYTNGAYRTFLKNGVSPDSNGLPTGSTSTAEQAGLTGDIGGAIGKGFADAFQALLQPLISTFIWGGEIILGILAMMAGVTIFALNTDAGKSAENKIREAALLAAAPEAAPAVLKSSTPQVPQQTTKGVPVKKTSTAPRVAHSQAEFEAMRRSGYNGPIRHDYKRSGGNG